MAKIYSPRRGYNGISATVRFMNGVGECTDPDLLEWFREKGYTVELEESENTEPEEESTKKVTRRAKSKEVADSNE